VSEDPCSTRVWTSESDGGPADFAPKPPGTRSQGGQCGKASPVTGGDKCFTKGSRENAWGGHADVRPKGFAFLIRRVRGLEED